MGDKPIDNKGKPAGQGALADSERVTEIHQPSQRRAGKISPQAVQAQAPQPDRFNEDTWFHSAPTQPSQPSQPSGRAGGSGIWGVFRIGRGVKKHALVKAAEKEDKAVQKLLDKSGGQFLNLTAVHENHTQLLQEARISAAQAWLEAAAHSQEIGLSWRQELEAYTKAASYFKGADPKNQAFLKQSLGAMKRGLVAVSRIEDAVIRAQEVSKMIGRIAEFAREVLASPLRPMDAPFWQAERALASLERDNLWGLINTPDQSKQHRADVQNAMREIEKYCGIVQDPDAKAELEVAKREIEARYYAYLFWVSLNLEERAARNPDIRVLIKLRKDVIDPLFEKAETILATAANFNVLARAYERRAKIFRLLAVDFKREKRAWHGQIVVSSLEKLLALQNRFSPKKEAVTQQVQVNANPRTDTQLKRYEKRFKKRRGALSQSEPVRLQKSVLGAEWKQILQSLRERNGHEARSAAFRIVLHIMEDGHHPDFKHRLLELLHTLLLRAEKQMQSRIKRKDASPPDIAIYETVKGDLVEFLITIPYRADDGTRYTVKKINPATKTAFANAIRDLKNPPPPPEGITAEQVIDDFMHAIEISDPVRKQKPESWHRLKKVLLRKAARELNGYTEEFAAYLRYISLKEKSPDTQAAVERPVKTLNDPSPGFKTFRKYISVRKISSDTQAAFNSAIKILKYPSPKIKPEDLPKEIEAKLVALRYSDPYRAQNEASQERLIRVFLRKAAVELKDHPQQLEIFRKHIFVPVSGSTTGKTAGLEGDGIAAPVGPGLDDSFSMINDAIDEIQGGASIEKQGKFPLDPNQIKLSLGKQGIIGIRGGVAPNPMTAPSGPTVGWIKDFSGNNAVQRLIRPSLHLSNSPTSASARSPRLSRAYRGTHWHTAALRRRARSRTTVARSSASLIFARSRRRSALRTAMRARSRIRAH